MKQKRLMLLGGLRYLLPVIEAAHQQGYYVICLTILLTNIVMNSVMSVSLTRMPF